MCFLVDSHCHLASLTFDGSKGAQNIGEIIARARATGVTHMLSVACTIEDYHSMKRLIQPYDGIFTSCGIHPLNLEEAGEWTDESLMECLNDPQCIAVGETGLDYFYASETRDAQIKSFSRQLEIAKTIKKPLIIHARAAHQDTVSLMRSFNAQDCGGVMHCFCDEVEMAKECLDLGFYISFSGIATFKAADNVREALKYVPLDRLMVETDCPYLAPVPVRGVDNEPAFVRYTLEFIADLKGVSPKELAKITSKNFSDCFKVQLTTPQDLNLPQKDISTYKLEKIFNKGWPY